MLLDRDSAQDSASGGPAPTSASANTAPVSGFTPIGRFDVRGVQMPTSGVPARPAGNGAARCAPLDIAMAGALTGPNAPLGVNVQRGVLLALEQFSTANPACAVKLRVVDTKGEPATAAQALPQVIADSGVRALIGPVFSGETKATGAALSDAGLPFLTPGATNSVLSTSGFRTFFRGLSDDDQQGPILARYITGRAGYRTVCVVHDDTDYGTGLGRSITAALGTAVPGSCDVGVRRADAAAIPAAARQIATVRPDAVVYAGYYDGAATMVRELRAAGSTAAFLAGDGALDPAFTEQAGEAGRAAVMSCPCGPGDGDFATAYRAAWGTDPGIYSAEAYDLTTIVLTGIAAGRTTRAELVDYLRSYRGTGVAGSYIWDATGELVHQRIWLYRNGS